MIWIFLYNFPTSANGMPGVIWVNRLLSIVWLYAVDVVQSQSLHYESQVFTKVTSLYVVLVHVGTDVVVCKDWERLVSLWLFVGKYLC